MTPMLHDAITALLVWILVLLPIASVLIALLLACALRVTRRRVRPYGLLAEAGDPFFYPFGEMPCLPREHEKLFQPKRVKLVFGRGVRKRDASDFRAWGVPDQSQLPVALRQNESGGRLASTSGTAVVLTFPTGRG
ncbi:hypothetical protein ACRQ5Q_16740 [Bradyrhizobium sp. PMVTL-01]|uniref:hypothetical protein n=1 Tax=Bradyrhizobium sp. PMVTL-01 TaxID=3434999 RepID=UPI003F700223